MDKNPPCARPAGAFDRARMCFLCGEMDLLDRELMFFSTITGISSGWAVRLTCRQCGDQIDGKELGRAA